jgi:hypothetical protein
MMAMTNEQRRLKARIADFERCITEARENTGGSDSRFMGNGQQDQMLQMLVRTLKALKARQAALHNW